MSKSKRQINLEYWIARALLAAFSVLPLRFALALGAGFGRIGYFFLGKLRRRGEKNLQIAFPELSEIQRRRLLQGFFKNLGRQLGLFSHFQKESSNKLREIIHPEGLEYLDEARQNKRGVILFTGHIGAWELSSFALSLFERPLSFLVRRIDNPKVEALIDSIRTRYGNRTIDKRSAAREMLQIMRAGDTLGILVDLNTHEREGIFVDFFGIPASTTFVLAKLALRTGATVLPVFAPWDEQKRRFLLKIDQPLVINRTGDEQADVQLLTQQFTSVVEDFVRRYPDQWLWIHRRWRIQPEGQPDLYE